GMSQWYTYVNLQELKDSSGGLKCFYGVVDEIEDRNDGCSHFRLWDQSNCTVIIKLMGPFVRNIEKGDVIRVHRLLRKDQDDFHGTIGFGEAGRTTQVVVWRRNEDVVSFIGSSSANYTRNENEIKSVVEKLHVEWTKVAEEMRLSMGDMTGLTQLDSFDNTVILREATGNADTDSFLDSTASQGNLARNAILDSFLDDSTSEVITGRNSALNSFLHNTTQRDPEINLALDSFLDNTITQADPKERNTLESFLDNTVAQGEAEYNVNTLFVADVDNERNAENNEPLIECSLNVDSTVTEKRLTSLLDETMDYSFDETSQEVYRYDPSDIPPPPHLTQNQELRLKKAACLPELKENQYYDVILQVVQAYYEVDPVEHVVMTCWDTHSSIPSFTKPLRTYDVNTESTDKEMFTPNESLIEASRGHTVDIFCYDYNRHVGEDGYYFMSGDWLLFSNLRVTVLNKDTILCMHADGSAKGRCIIRIPREFIPENKENEQATIDASVPIEMEHGSEEESFIARLNSLRNVKDDNSSGVIENTVPRCKLIHPYLKWNRPIVPVNIMDDSSSVDLVSKMNCNCGVPLTQDESECVDPEKKTKRHEYFFRNNFNFVQLNESSVDKEISFPFQNEILPSISCIGRRGMPSTFDLVVQISHLSVEKRREFMIAGIPLSHITVWDGTRPPESIDGGRLLGNLTTRADKICVGKAPLLNLHTIDVRLASPRKCKEGEFAIIRDVIVVRAYSEVSDNGSLLPVWMLQARDMTVIRTLSESTEEKRAFMSVAKRISNAIVSAEERVEETQGNENMELKKGTMKRKITSSENAKRSKMIWLEEETWLDELARKHENGIESQEETTYNLKSRHGSVAPPISKFQNFDLNNRKFSNLVAYFENGDNSKIVFDPRRDVWLQWMKPCHTFNTIKEKSEQVGCCPIQCGGEISQFVHIPIKNPLDQSKGSFSLQEKLLHFLIDASHFRANNTHLSHTKWKTYSSKVKEDDTKKIVAKINESSIIVRRVSMMYLKSKVVFVVHKGNDWLTISKKSSR
ncbi:hypothetical protein PRIPAC_75593, partial [Pristionchus pacificus]